MNSRERYYVRTADLSYLFSGSSSSSSLAFSISSFSKHNGRCTNDEEKNCVSVLPLPVPTTIINILLSTTTQLGAFNSSDHIICDTTGECKSSGIEIGKCRKCKLHSYVVAVKVKRSPKIKYKNGLLIANATSSLHYELEQLN